jgi:hypothetical protein
VYLGVSPSRKGIYNLDSFLPTVKHRVDSGKRLNMGPPDISLFSRFVDPLHVALDGRGGSPLPGTAIEFMFKFFKPIFDSGLHCMEEPREDF